MRFCLFPSLTYPLVSSLFFAATWYACGGNGKDGSATGSVGPMGQMAGGAAGGIAKIPPVVAQYGLDERPINRTCVAPARPPLPSAVKLERVFPALTLATPMVLTQPPGDPSRFFVAQRDGDVVAFPASDPTDAKKKTVLKIPGTVSTEGEGGLLGFAFHPLFAQNGHIFFSYTTNGGSTNLRSVVARMTSKDGGETFADYQEILGPFEQPYTNHNGGDAHFGRDGFLYLSFGDGGDQGDPLGHGQSTSTFFSKILRIDVDNPAAGKAYGIPSDNPFVAGGGEPATFAYGFRNPFRFSVDRETGQVWAGDVGGGEREEVDLVVNGGNFGWSVREGTLCHKPAQNCLSDGLIAPEFEYAHDEGNSITGGVVYRGKAIPSFVGTYLYADFGSGRVWSLAQEQDGKYVSKEMPTGGGANWVGFGESADGEVYGVSIGGEIYRLVEAAPAAVSTFPTKLSQTGCVDPADPTRPSSGLLPYATRSPLWSDGAEKERFVALPEDGKITVGADGDFDFPKGTVTVKNFLLDGRRVETRLYIRHDDGGWAGYSYEWDDDGKDATLLPSSKVKTIGNRTWTFPSRAQCSQCHTQAAGYTLGLELGQLNHDITYDSTNRLSNQLRTLEHLNVFAAPLSAPPEQLTGLPDPAGSESVDARARAYLHANCASCHRPEGGGGGTIDFRFITPLANTGICNAAPANGDLGIPDSRILVPGDPSKSLLFLRAQTTGANRMPPIASSVVDQNGTALLEAWIKSLTACPLNAL